MIRRSVIGNLVRAGLVGGALAVAGMTAGCGFTPLYGESGVTPSLSAISVVAPQGRTAYLIRESLDDAFLHDSDTPAKYRLSYTLKEQRYPRGLRSDNVASRYELHVDVNYTLTEIETGKALKTGAQSVVVTYDSADQPYAGVAAQEDGERRAAEQAAQRIRIDLATYFADRIKKP